jgi:5-methylcytosine-specific restriction endonuclease McrA
MNSGACGWCEASLAGMRSNARFCSRACKTKASDRRRIVDGREQARNLARYPAEAEARRAWARKYLAENPERMRAIRRKRKGQIRADMRLVTERDWRRLVARYRGCCAYCGVKPTQLHRDHVVPLARGGRHSIGNLLPACPRCNLSKKTKYLFEWRHQRQMAGVG